MLKPGGRYVILEFSTPGFAPWRAVYHVYLRQAIPAIGGMLTGDRAGIRLPQRLDPPVPHTASARGRAARGGLQRRSAGRTFRRHRRAAHRREVAAASTRRCRFSALGCGRIATNPETGGLPCCSPHATCCPSPRPTSSTAPCWSRATGSSRSATSSTCVRSIPTSRFATSGSRRSCRASSTCTRTSSTPRCAASSTTCPTRSGSSSSCRRSGCSRARTGTTRHFSARSRRCSRASPPSPTSPRRARQATPRRRAGLRAHVYREVATMEKHKVGQVMERAASPTSRHGVRRATLRA